MEELRKSCKNLSQNLKKYRRKIKITQDKISKLSKVEYKYYQSLEGKNPPNITLKTLDKLAKALGVEPFELLKNPEE